MTLGPTDFGSQPTKVVPAWTVVHHLLHTAGTEATQGWELSKAPDSRQPICGGTSILGVGNSRCCSVWGGVEMLWVLVTVMVVRQWGCLLGLEEKDSQEHPSSLALVCLGSGLFPGSGGALLFCHHPGYQLETEFKENL